MMKKLVYISILSLLLLSSCRSKRMITVSLPQPVMQADSTQLGDTIGLPARLSPMFTFDQSDLRNVRRQPAKGEVKKQQIKKTAPVQKVIVQRGTRIIWAAVDADVDLARTFRCVNDIRTGGVIVA